MRRLTCGAPRLGAPSPGELRGIAWEACEKTLAHLRAQGRWLDLDEDLGAVDGDDPLSLDAPLLAEIYVKRTVRV